MRFLRQNKKRLLEIFIVIFLASCTLLSCESASQETVPPPSLSTIRVVMDTHYPPYIFLDEAGVPQGILVDQWKLWEQRTGIGVEIYAIAWDDALESMKRGEYDVIDTIFYTEKRAEFYDFSKPYVRIDVPIFFNNNISGIADVDDLKGFRVAVKAGDANVEFLQKQGISDLVYYDSYEAIIQAAARGEENVFVIDQPPGLYYLYKYGLQNQFNYSKPLFSGEFHRAVKKGDVEMLALVEGGFASISEEEYRKIDERWFGVKQSNNQLKIYLPYLMMIALGAFLVILVLFVFNRILQRRVNLRTLELKQALADLQKSERKYREIFNATTEAIFIHAMPGGELLHVNESMLRMYGYDSEQEVLSKGLLILGSNTPPYTATDAIRWMRLALEEGPQVLEWQASRKNGELFWTEISLRYSQIGGEGQVLAVVRDITERKQAEQALRESEARYQQAISMISNIIWRYEVDEQGRFVTSYISPAVDQMLGLPPGSIRYDFDRYFSYVHPEDLPFVREIFFSALAGLTQNESAEYRLCRPDGSVIWVHTNGSASLQVNGHIVASGISSDITERKQAEHLLRERERQYRTLVEQIPAIVYLDDVSDGIHTIYVSPQVEKILGYTPQEWVERSPGIWDECTKEEDRDAIHKKYLQCMETGEPFEAEYRMVSADGRLLWLHDQAVILRSENGTPQFAHGVMQDITAHKLAEVKMHQRVTELETVHEGGLAINQLLDPGQIGQKIVELLEQKLGWKYTAVILYHPQDESLELLAFNLSGLETEVEQREAAERFKALIHHSSQGVTGWVTRHKQAIRLGDVSLCPDYVEVCPGIKSGLYVPMKLGDRVVGTINIESEDPDAFSVEDERLAVTLANQAASALENARLFKAEQKQRQVSDALRDALSAGASLSASLNYETVFDRLLEALGRVVPFEGGSIMVIQKETQTVHIARMRGYEMLGRDALEKITNHKFDFNTAENLRWMLENKQPLVIPDVQKYPGWITVEETSFIRSWTGVPIIVNDEVIAFFSLDSREPNFFTREHAELIKAFTGQASLALHNARLFEQTERRFREFAALYETSKVLSTETDLPDLMQAIVENAQKLLNSASSGIYLYDSEKEELFLVVDTGPHIKAGPYLKMGEGVGGIVAQTRQPLRVDDYSTWEGRSRQFEGIKIRAVLEVPMLYSGELIGVLTADEVNDSKRKFTDADERLLSLFASQAAGAIHSARLREQTERRLGQLQALHTIDRAISSTFDLRPILNTVINQTIIQLNVDAVDILLYHPHLQMLDYVVGQGFRTRAIEQTRLRLGECFSGRAAYERRTVHVSSLPEAGSSFTRAVILQAEGFLEFYAVPLIAKGQVKGVMEVFHREPLPKALEWIEFLETLAGQAAITIDQTQLFEDLQRANLELIIAYDATIEGWARAMDLRDKETESHTERVTELTISLARMFNIRDDEIVHMRRGALLHDIGKIGVPDHILLKEGALTEDEWKIMRRHPQFAYEMLQPIRYLRQALEIPYCHHEKWDGTGYPRGLKGEQIPIVARIFAVADVWDAITSNRPYRKALTNEEALAYIRGQSGRHFDPQVVDAFLKVMGVLQ